MYRPRRHRVQLNLLDSHDTPRFLTDGRRATAPRTTSPSCSRRRCPARRASTTATRSASRATTTRTAAARFPWDEARWDREGLAWTRAAFAARHALPALRRGTFRLAGAVDDALAYVRGEVSGHPGGAPVLVAVNAGEAPAELRIGVPELAGGFLVDAALPRPDTAGDPAPVLVAADGSARLPVPPRSGRILVAGGHAG